MRYDSRTGTLDCQVSPDGKIRASARNLNTRLVSFRLYSNILFLTFLVLISRPIFCLTIDSTFLEQTDSLFSLSGEAQITVVTAVKERHMVYRSFTVRTIYHEFGRVEELLTDMRKYYEISKYLRRAIPIDTTSPDSQSRTYFLEMGIFLATSWYMSDVYTRYSNDSKEMRIILKQHRDSILYEKWKNEVKGIFKVGYYDFIIWYRLKDLGNGKTRLAITAFVEPTIWIPVWLNKLASKIIFPGLLKEIDKELSKGHLKKL